MAAVILLAACDGGDGAASDAADAGSTPAVASASSVNGEALYQQRCSSCHQMTGEGLTGVYPPLTGSEYVTASNVALPVRVVLHGLQGPITIKGAEYNSLMPAYGLGIVMSDVEVAAVVTYIRSSWGNSASAVTPEQVAQEREATKDHTGAMTAELLAPLLSR
jgi:mono/diheme cytochrome c family protein